MKVVVGLGNPGAEYERTPHNVGFLSIDCLAERLGCRLKASSKFEAFVGTADYAGEELILVKPQTYMNHSGRSVGAVLNYRKLTPAELLVVVDDADIPLGALRLRKKGGTGGHRGLVSVSEVLGTTDYARVRVGIGRGFVRDDLVDHVLGKFGREEWAVVQETIAKAADAVQVVVEKGMDVAMNRFNAGQEHPAGGDEGTAGGKKQ
ncbi:MAG: aminoacyl-tRNA hydrolase [bacterium]